MKRNRVMSTDGVLAVITDQLLTENKPRFRKLTKKQMMQKKHTNDQDSSFEIIEKNTPQLKNTKIKITKQALDHFINKTFVVISDDDAEILDKNSNSIKNETTSRSSSILSSSSSNLEKCDKAEKKVKLGEN
ncbi:unnamed protein product (macronuclear) [Paramecium tetraurelia]|uniref:Uncharacterized protein n=1 Tax=Paramecium tetraurelia TaxID=5888 RepID=A0D209_PARTE|nr:uncharacterized protein GSPATT00012582001 [Paramecium tetraurelia]CAK77076.1 unnamed protein product [Paramecium tetraurelia]|eukprot:XP_001444473.1 hypothetical protein (macronuclear) [Paramecium tetraurelia strain d4-2]